MRQRKRTTAHHEHHHVTEAADEQEVVIGGIDGGKEFVCGIFFLLFPFRYVFFFLKNSTFLSREIEASCTFIAEIFSHRNM